MGRQWPPDGIKMPSGSEVIITLIIPATVELVSCDKPSPGPASCHLIFPLLPLPTSPYW